MKNLFLLAGAIALGSTAPAFAKPGNAHSHGHAKYANGGHGHSRYATIGHGRSSRDVIVTRHGRVYALDMRGRCPPGLAKRYNGCVPPGQARKMYSVGHRYNRNFGNAWTYNQIPNYLRSQYNFDRNDRYYYRNGYLYQVNPRTMLVEQVISALLR